MHSKSQSWLKPPGSERLAKVRRTVKRLTLRYPQVPIAILRHSSSSSSARRSIWIKSLRHHAPEPAFLGACPNVLAHPPNTLLRQDRCGPR
jgi:hypothetical protein